MTTIAGPGAPGTTYVFNLGSYDAAVSTRKHHVSKGWGWMGRYLLADLRHPPRPVPQVYSGGEPCNGTPRRTAVNFACNPGLPTDVIVEASEGPVCVYSILVHTPRLCCEEAKMQCMERAPSERWQGGPHLPA